MTDVIVAALLEPRAHIPRDAPLEADPDEDSATSEPFGCFERSGVAVA